jgi:hypothetical protein
LIVIDRSANNFPDPRHGDTAVMDRFNSIYPAALTKRLPPAPPLGDAGASKENLAGKVNVWKTTPAPKTKSQRPRPLTFA